MEKMFTTDQLERLATDAEFATAAMECTVATEERGEIEVALPLLQDAITRMIAISTRFREMEVSA